MGQEPQSFSHVFPGESGRAAGKGRGSQRARGKRGSRARASKDTSKLLLLYDEDILERDPLREQKDLAFAQAYLTRVGRCCFLLLPVSPNAAASPSRDQFLKQSMIFGLCSFGLCLCFLELPSDLRESASRTQA